MRSPAIVTLRDMVLRWNKSFSLVSRQDPVRQTDELIDECLVSGRALMAQLAQSRATDHLHYIDLGTGGGFPGLVWHELLATDPVLSGRHIGTDLIEPRTKRAWFLEQASRAMNQSGVSIHEHLWSTSIPPLRAINKPDVIMISMKALHLSDSQVLAGLGAFMPGSHDTDVVIIRFVANWEGDPDMLGVHGPSNPVPSLSGAATPGFFILEYPSRRPASILFCSYYPAGQHLG